MWYLVSMESLHMKGVGTIVYSGLKIARFTSRVWVTNYDAQISKADALLGLEGLPSKICYLIWRFIFPICCKGQYGMGFQLAKRELPAC
jgi:hypothetical protein